ncbi:MAG: S8 family serine peptidase [Rubrivivax sp.]
MTRNNTPRHLAALCAALAMAACGGGGGGDAAPSPAPSPSPSPTPSSFTIGGTLTIAENLVLDSDTNDPNQSPRASNDEFESAQPITATSQVMGTVNVANKGPAGASFAAGDLIDGFKVTVAAGQTVELDFTADPAVNDLDLYVFQLVGGSYQLVGQSIDQNSSECVRFSAAGTYIVGVQAYWGASLYNLRVTAPGATSRCANATSTEAPLIAGELVVGLREGSSARAPRASAQALTQGLTVQRGAIAPGRLALVKLPEGNPRAHAQATGRRNLFDQLPLEAQRQIATVAHAKRLRASGAFDHVMFNRVLKTNALIGSFPPNDPRYPQQRWHYEQISLPAAMTQLVADGNHATRPIVAVVDTGIVADHPDLAPQIVDGYDFVKDPASSGDGDGIDGNPDDLRSAASQPSFHGSHVAGTIAASTFDGAGAAGVAPMAQLMPLRALGEGGSGSFYDITQAIQYAAGLPNDSPRVPARRADVINLSLGAAGAACDADSASFFASVRAKGTIVVAAAGNEANRPAGVSAPVGYPANCPGVIAVSATDPQRGIAPYSSTGAEVAVAAPGGDMRFSTTGTGQPDGVYSTLATFDGGGRRVPTFGVLQGTSMATPHVAGVLALMRWVFPGITPSQVDTLLASGALTDEAGAAGRDTLYGYGIVNAAKAVQAAITLRDGSAPPTAGVIEAQPAALDFGSTATTLDFTLRTTADTAEKVTAVSSPSAAVTVAALAVDAATGLGSYRVTVDRTQLADGVATPAITVQTTARTLTVQLTIEKRSTPAAGGDLGPVYVLVYDADTNDLVGQVTVQASGGRYRWSLAGVKARNVVIVAGSDYDNDGLICSRGEACGAYPVLGAQATPVPVTGDRSDLGFLLAPVGAGNTAGTAGARASVVQKRLPNPIDSSVGSTLNLPWSAPFR